MVSDCLHSPPFAPLLALPLLFYRASLAFWQRSNAKADEQLDICVTIATVFMECKKMSPGKTFGMGPWQSTVKAASKQCKEHPACFWDGVADPENTEKEVGGQCAMKDSYDTSKITPKTTVQSWKNEQACKFELQATKKFENQEAEKREAEAQKREAAKIISPEDVAESVKRRDAIADKVGKAPERRELVKFQAQVRRQPLFCSFMVWFLETQHVLTGLSHLLVRAGRRSECQTVSTR